MVEALHIPSVNLGRPSVVTANWPRFSHRRVILGDDKRYDATMPGDDLKAATLCTRMNSSRGEYFASRAFGHSRVGSGDGLVIRFKFEHFL